MFRGVIKDNTKKILIDYIKISNNPKVAVGCFGAFTIENILVSNFNPTHILSCDVTNFTTALGYFLMGKDYEASIVNPDFAFLNDVMAKGLEFKTASLLYLQDVADFYRSKNFYNKRMISTYQEEYVSIISKKAKRLLEVKEIFDNSGVKFEYKAQDVVDFVKEVPEDYLFVAFPPFYFGDYEKQYKFLRETIHSPELECDYKMFDEESLKGLVNTLIERKVNFIIGTNKPELFADNPNINDVSYDYFSRNEVVHFITDTDLGNKIVGMNTRSIDSYDVELVTEKDIEAMDENTNIEVKEIPLDLLDSIRRTRISHKVKKLTAPLTKFGCFADGKLFGVFGIDVINMKYKSNKFYLLSDLPVVNTGKISKLVPALATSREIREYLKRTYLVGHDKILTTCFTEKPTSMKYRNFWKIHAIKIDKEMGRFINYSSEMGTFNIKEIYQKWLRLLNTKLQQRKTKRIRIQGFAQGEYSY